jgi:hypothetical protein
VIDGGDNKINTGSIMVQYLLSQGYLMAKITIMLMRRATSISLFGALKGTSIL